MAQQPIKFSGPMFINAPQHFKNAANSALSDVAIRASVLVKAQLWGNGKTVKHGRRTGDLRASILGELTQDFTAQVLPTRAKGGNPLVYANWVEGISTRNRTSRFKGYGMFKQTAEHMRKKPKWMMDIFKEALSKEFS